MPGRTAVAVAFAASTVATFAPFPAVRVARALSLPPSSARPPARARARTALSVVARARRRISTPPIPMPIHFGRRARAPAAATESTPLVGAQRATPNRDDGIDWLGTWRFVAPFVNPETLLLKLMAVVAVICVITRKFLALLPPYAYKLAVDALANNLLGDRSMAVVPYAAIVLYIAARLGTNFFQVIQDYCYTKVAATCTRRFSVAIFGHLQRLSLAFHLHRKTGEVTRIMDRGASSIDTIANTVIFTLFPTLLEVVVVTGIFLKLGTPLIALATFVTVMLYFAYTFYVTAYRIKLRRDLIEADNAVSEKAVDTLINYETVKMFGMEEEETRAYETLQSRYQDSYVWFRVSLNTLNFGQSSIQTIGLGACAILAAIAAAKGTLTPGDFVLVNTYVQQLFQPLFFLGATYRMITQAATDVEKCKQLFNTDITVQDLPEAKGLDMKEQDLLEGRVGEVRFDNVSFKYDGGERGSAGGLKHISFTVKPGHMVALVGASGAGKSTIIRLLLRFYDVDEGGVFIDGKDIRGFTQRSLRTQIGVVAQDTVLFNQSLRYNISYGKQDATDAEIFQAARSAALGDFVESLPEKLDTLVGERGVRLSGGERQRVGCARCFIKAPSIVLLDEASASLDTNTEREMQANLRDICRNRTTIVIAHRLSTIVMANEIIVLGKDEDDETLGTIIERGSHSDLLKQQGSYAEMWEAQTALPEDNASEATEPGLPN